MTMEPTISPSEFIILKCLYDQKGASLNQMMECLKHHEKQNASEWTYATVSVFLQRLIKKNFVERRKEDKVYFYQLTKTLWQAMEPILNHYFGSNTKTFLFFYLQHRKTQSLNKYETNLEFIITPFEFLVLLYLNQNGGASIHQIISYLQHQEKKQFTWAYSTILILLTRLIKKGFVDYSGKKGSHYYRPRRTLLNSMDVIFDQYFGSSTNSLLISYLEHNRLSLTKQEKKMLDRMSMLQNLPINESPLFEPGNLGEEKKEENLLHAR